MELVQLPPRSTSYSISSYGCSLLLHLTKEYRAEISPTLCAAAGQERQKWGVRGPAAVTAGREHWWEMPSTLQSSPSESSLSSGSHPHPEPSPLQTSWFQGHSTALWGRFVPPGARAMPEFLPQSDAVFPTVCVSQPCPPAAAGTRGGQAGPGSGPGRLPQPGGSEGEQGTQAALPLTAHTAGHSASHCSGLSIWGEEAGAAPDGKGGRPRSRDTLWQWHRGGQRG